MYEHALFRIFSRFTSLDLINLEEERQEKQEKERKVEADINGKEWVAEIGWQRKLRKIS